jgi:GNAT superfamily N-acetyltransferase
MIKKHNAAHHKPFSIRAARRGDAPAVTALAVAMVAELNGEPPRLTAGGWQAISFGPGRVMRTLVAVVDGQVVGFVFYYPGFDLQTASAGMHLCDLFVDREHRGQGIGKSLFLRVGMECLRNGGEWLAWTVLRHNAAADGFYQALGGVRIPDIQAQAIGKHALLHLLSEAEVLP